MSQQKKKRLRASSKAPRASGLKDSSKIPHEDSTPLSRDRERGAGGIGRQKTTPKLIGDRVFKRYFKNSKETVITLLNQFLPLPEGRVIKSIEFLDSVMHSDKLKNKDSVLDLRVRLDNGYLVNIEMQSLSQYDFKERILYYLAKLFTSSLKEGEEYEKLCPAYSLIFADFTIFKNLKSYYTTFRLKADQNPDVMFSDHLGVILVELNKFKKVDLKSLNKRDSWCYIMNNSDSLTSEDCNIIAGKGGDMKQAVNRWQKLSKEESLQIIAEAEERERRDRVGQIAYGRKEAKEEGRKEGLKEGMEKGLEQAVTALGMIRAGAKLEEICKATGFSQDKIRKLKKSEGI